MEREIAISMRGVKKQYRLGQIGGGTLTADLQSLWARLRGKEDPNTKLGTDQRLVGQTFLALNGIDLTVYKGEALGIIGGNGAGKSTLLKILSRVTAPTAGEIDIYGRITSMLEVGTGFHGEMTGRENVYLNGAILGMTRAEIDAKMEDILEFSQVRAFIDTPVKRYSSGMYVKLAFSVAAHLDSEILIMDEVLAVGDMAFQKKCLDRMGHAKTEGRTVLYVSHNMNTILKLCDRCIVLEEGRIIFDGDPKQAVSIYLGRGSGQLRNDCANAPREPICRGGVRMRSTEILSAAPVVYDDQFLKVKLSFRAERDFPKLMFRMILFSGGNPVGMMTSDGFVKANQGENQVTLSFDLNHLSPGTYTGRMVFYEVNEFGGETIRDVADPAVTFRKEYTAPDDTAQIWKEAVWGNIRFPAAKVNYETDETVRLFCPESGR